MKKIKKALLTALSCVFAVSALTGIAACGGKANLTPVSVTKLTPEFAYIVGDSVHMFDHFKYINGLEYTFTVAHEEEEAERVEGSSFYLGKEGEYTITCTVMNGKESKTDFVTIFVGNEKAFMQFKNRQSKVDWMRSMWDTDILALAEPLTIVNCEYETYIESVTIYDAADGSGRTVTIEDGVKIQDAAGTFYNGADRFTFVYECDYVFTVVCETSGGKVSNDFTIQAKENFDKLELLSDYSLAYDKTTYTATWDAVDGASSYYVKVDRRQQTVTDTTIDIEDMLVSEFQYFDLHVVPLDASGNRMGKLVYEDVVIAPDGSDGLVKGLGATVNPAMKEVTLAGKQSATAGYATGMRYVKNSYVAFGYKYGIGTYVDFEFTGNNLPQLCFFANEINENMTCDSGLTHLTKPNEGYLLMNGLAVASETNVRGANTLICVGPYRFGCDTQDENKVYIHGKKSSNRAHKNYIAVSEETKTFTVSSNSLFTYNGLKAAGQDQKYQYTVGTFVSGGKLAFDLVLRDGVTGAILETARFVTDSDASDIKPGHIIVYAGVKGDGVDTSFTYGIPYKGEPLPEEGVFRPDKTDPYLVSLVGKKSASAGWKSGVGAMANSHIGIVGNYGVGTYIDFFFTGNNLPQVALFANNINGNMTAGVSLTETGAEANANTGFILMNGLYSADPGLSKFKNTSKVIGENRLICVGPYKLGNNNYVTASEETVKFTVSEDSLFTQQKLREDTSGRTYKYTVGSKISSGLVKIVVFLYDDETNELIATGEYATGMTQEKVEALGGNIIVYGCVKGENDATEFKYSAPYEGKVSDSEGADAPDGMKAAGATFNGDGTVTLQARETGGSVSIEKIGSIEADYIAWEGNYGIGTYVDFTFKGNNMPQVMFFADKINGNMTSSGGSGVICMNGITKQGSTNSFCRCSDYLVFGPNRINANDTQKNYDSGQQIATILSTGTTANPGNYPLLSQTGLKGTPDTAYAYTVGTYEGTDGYLYIDIYLSYADTNELIYHIEKKTKLKVSNMTVISGNIVAYTCWKGSSDTETTTFGYGVPYTKNV